MVEYQEEIEQLSTRDELRKIFQSLPKGKALGLDDMMAKTLLASWSFI